MYKKTHTFLRKGQGRLASDYHGETKFSKQRKEKIVKEQIIREKKMYNNSKK